MMMLRKIVPVILPPRRRQRMRGVVNSLRKKRQQRRYYNISTTPQLTTLPIIPSRPVEYIYLRKKSKNVTPKLPPSPQKDTSPHTRYAIWLYILCL
jgi:hypothetical protein